MRAERSGPSFSLLVDACASEWAPDPHGLAPAAEAPDAPGPAPTPPRPSPGGGAGVRRLLVPLLDEWDAPTVPGTVAARSVPCEGPDDVIGLDGLVMRGLVAEGCP